MNAVKEETPAERASFLMRCCGSRPQAVRHAFWAFENAEKKQVRDFWWNVIKALQ